MQNNNYLRYGRIFGTQKSVCCKRFSVLQMSKLDTQCLLINVVHEQLHKLSVVNYVLYTTIILKSISRVRCNQDTQHVANKIF